eukprot:TRINITY_DN28349_c0_g1_i2.p1 TRINITY_DN28349_c0_g1~~TRINITY_DN28349_c0_g1_i2.p1  ORF type:complete len:223 (+),score=45.18 TRINITY_DN28349_c0_g1_i2:84-752(+)
MRRARGALLLLASAGGSFRLHHSWAPSRVLVKPCWTRYNSFPTRRFAGPSAMAITVLTTEDAADKAEKVAVASKTLADAQVSTEEVKSYYWWEGKVNFDPEWRVAVTTSSPFETARDAISKVHSYDLPMIIYDLEAVPDGHAYWKGLIQLSGDDAIKMAEKLVERRIVACAQAAPSGMLAVKTVARCKALVEESAGTAISWSPIGGNEGYLKWLEDECVGGA